MKITVFTSNQPRHLALVKKLAAISNQTYAVLECNTVFPGLVSDFFKKTDVMRDYFENVMRAEKALYGNVDFLPSNVRTLSVKSGDLNKLNKETLEVALSSDVYIVFGASYIKEWLVDFLVENKAINIHMGISPYYRGSSCNFWALYDEKPEYVGSTIHLLSKGLDSGDMLYHALPILNDEDPFLFTMKSVEAAQVSLAQKINDRTLFDMTPVAQDKGAEIRYTRNADFTDEVASEFLSRGIHNGKLRELYAAAKKYPLLSPFYF
jgi:folate-dependent phosphoribosylglycinamide formyltransferase PurN